MKWFRNLKTSVKLISSFTLLAIVALIVGLFAIINMNSLSNNMDNLYTNQLKPIEFLLQATTSTSETKNHVRASLLATDSTQQSNYVSQVNSDLKSMDTNLNQYSKTHLSADEQKVYDGVPADVQNFKDAVDNIESLMQAGDKQQAIKQLTTSLSPAENKLSDALNKLATINHNNAKQANADGKSLSASSRNIMIIIIAAAILIALALGFLISHLIANPLKRISDLVSKVSKGDLRETTDIDSKDEVGQLAKSVNSMVLQLREVINGILGSAENLLASSQEISAATEQVASGSTSQAQASETVNQLFKELSDAITSVAQNAEEAAGLSSQTTDLAKKGETIVQSSVEGMNNVNDHMVRLSDDSNRVGEIVEVIDDIADQTNLLALNAAIEAARAGDQGRGFAVVADEVRKLAERTSEATKQIGAIIKTMQENMTTSVQSVSEGVTLTENSGAAFKDIVGMVNNTATKVSEIAAAGEEQSAQASEVLVAVESIATAAEEAAASSEETASSSQTLARLAQDLQEYVAVFKVN